MPRKRAPEVPPSEAFPEGESNRYLTKFKASLSKRWSSTRMETLYEIFDLAAFLWALERDDEALAIAGWVAASVPAPPPMPGRGFNYNVWCPATFSHGLLLHLATGAWRARADVSRAQLIRDTGIARNHPDFIGSEVAEARQLAASTAGQTTIKWECQSLAWTLGTLVLYSELANAGDSLFEEHSTEVAVLIPQLLSKLRTLLESAK